MRNAAQTTPSFPIQKISYSSAGHSSWITNPLKSSFHLRSMDIPHHGRPTASPPGTGRAPETRVTAASRTACFCCSQSTANASAELAGKDEAKVALESGVRKNYESLRASRRGTVPEMQWKRLLFWGPYSLQVRNYIEQSRFVSATFLVKKL